MPVFLTGLKKKKKRRHLTDSSFSPFPSPNLPVTLSCLCIQGALFAAASRCAGQRAWTAFFSVVVHLKIQTRKLCLKGFMCGNHDSRLPFSCVRVNSLINIAGKDRSRGCCSVSLLEESDLHPDGQFVRFSYFAKFCVVHGQAKAQVVRKGPFFQGWLGVGS